jgi:hypothetical protein
MSVPNSVVVPFAAFVAYRERRSRGAMALPRTSCIEVGAPRPSSAQDERKVAPEAANCDDPTRSGNDDRARCRGDAAAGSLSRIQEDAGVVATAGIERRQ